MSSGRCLHHPGMEVGRDGHKNCLTCHRLGLSVCVCVCEVASEPSDVTAVVPVFSHGNLIGPNNPRQAIYGSSTLDITDR